MGDLVPNLWDQLDFSSPKSNYDMMQEFNSQLKRQVTSRNVQFRFYITQKYILGALKVYQNIQGLEKGYKDM